MDIPILYSTAPQTMAFVAKKEMEKIPYVELLDERTRMRIY